MRRIIRAAGIGFVIGAALFFVPFVFRFLLFAVLFGFIMRGIFGRRRFYHRARWQHYSGYGDPATHHTQAVPIDGKWYRANMQQGGIENDIPLK